MKKTGSIAAALLILIISVIGVVLLLGRSSAMDDNTLSLITTDTSVESGDTVSIDINVESSEDVLAISSDVLFDSSQLEFVDFEDNSLLAGQAEEANGVIELILGDADPLSGRIGTLTFTVTADSGSTTVDLQNIDASSGDGSTVPFDSESVDITIGSGAGGAGNGFFISALTLAR